MKFSFPMPGGGTGMALFSRLVRTKDLRQMQPNAGGNDSRAPSSKPKLTKCLTTLDLTSLGVGSCCGTGMYLVAGMVARNVAGPGVILSFLIAALASIFSGACYAEFGVRVPHTSGSAYMYSYVTVGEFVAFIIGWNMILEYLIGTSACACALSASFDSLSGGSITRSIADTVTVFGHAPDFIAFGITLLMTGVLALGASKSVLFNNTLNAINLATWVFIVTAGLFYVDLDTWHEHQGFLPFGWSGVFTGAATCFYAFIGFDIIATTGEEAHNPQKSIPKAIVGSLLIVLVAYVSSSLILTLVVPFDHIDPGSALIQMWTYVGATKCRAVVVVGATAGLSVAMFGSMFPMPRVIYAMAQDGLVFRPLAQLWTRTNAPGLATVLSGLAAALVAMFVSLEVLVEMMSIGTLLAYTLVSACVLVLRYQPHSTTLADLLPVQLRTPQPTSGVTTPARPHHIGEVQTATTSLGGGGKPTKSVTVRKVTRGSPDSDDSFGDDSPDGYLGGRDDQFLVSDRNENKFYGSVHGAPTAGGNQSTLDGIGLGYVGRKFEEYAYLCPGLYPWVNPGPATHESGMYVTKLVGIMFGLIFVLDLMAAIGVSGTLAILTICALLCGILAILVLISRQPQNRYALAFLTPALPFVPTVAITVNVYLIFKLSILTLVRFTVWMTLGLIMYFYYGITHSTLEQPSDDIELTAGGQPTTTTVTITGPGNAAYASGSTSPASGAVWDRHGYENRMADDDWSHSQYDGSSWSRARPQATSSASGRAAAWGESAASSSSAAATTTKKTTGKKSTTGGRGKTTTATTTPATVLAPTTPVPTAPIGSVPGGFGIFVDESQFPTWDD